MSNEFELYSTSQVYVRSTKGEVDSYWKQIAAEEFIKSRHFNQKIFISCTKLRIMRVFIEGTTGGKRVTG